jgi:hypothetical protein
MLRLLVLLALLGGYYYIAQHDSSLALVIGACAVVGAALAYKLGQRLKRGIVLGIVLGLLAGGGYIYAGHHQTLTQANIAKSEAVWSALLLVVILAIGVSYIFGVRQLRLLFAWVSPQKDDADESNPGGDRKRR